MPVFKQVGDKVISSTLVKSGVINLQAEKVGSDTTINTIISLVEEAGNSKAPISRLADKVSGVFVPVVMSISLLCFIIWLSLGYGFEFAISIAVAVLVIACPCALGLATPVAIMVGTGKGAENGLLIKSAESLEQAHKIKTVVFDKTGTITEGKPTVDEVILLDKVSNTEFMTILYALENNSEHPLASSIIEDAKQKNIPLKEAKDYKAIVGMGLSASVDGVEYFAGNIKLIKQIGLYSNDLQSKIDALAKKGSTPLVLASKDKVIGIIAIKDKIKQSSINAVKSLKELGIDVVMLTGDNKLTAEAIAKEVGITHVISDVLPTDKQNVIKELKKDDKNLVAMVGDGVNDALALTTSDVGIAIGAGTDIAIDSADIVLVRNDIEDVANVIRLSKRVIGNIKLSLFWAFFYNTIGILLATGAFYSFGIKLNPMIGAACMSLSSFFVVTNALTINFFKIKRQDTACSLDNSACKLAIQAMENDKNISENHINNAENIEQNNEQKVINNTNNEQNNEQNVINNTNNGNSCNNSAKPATSNDKEYNMIIKVNGMMCGHCEARVEKVVSQIDGVASVKASHEKGEVEVVTNKDVNANVIKNAITNEGYEVLEEGTLLLKVNGMMCGHCEARVEKVVTQIDGVVSVKASHEKGEVEVVTNKDVDVNVIKTAITNEGYEIL